MSGHSCLPSWKYHNTDMSLSGDLQNQLGLVLPALLPWFPETNHHQKHHYLKSSNYTSSTYWGLTIKFWAMCRRKTRRKILTTRYESADFHMTGSGALSGSYSFSTCTFKLWICKFCCRLIIEIKVNSSRGPSKFCECKARSLLCWSSLDWRVFEPKSSRQ